MTGRPSPRFLQLVLLSAALVGTSVLGSACGSRGRGDDPPTESDAGTDGATDASGDATQDTDPPDIGTPDVMRDTNVPDVDTGPPPLDDVVVWAHSRDTLMSFDPRTQTVTVVGEFIPPSGLEVRGITDIAVTEDGDLYACGFESLYTVNSTTAQLTLVGDLGGVDFNGLTFLPRGVVDTTGETLVGATSEGDFYRIDPDSARTALLGSYSDDFQSSGDIVSVVGAGTFATVKRPDLETDFLVRFDPTTGTMTTIGDGIGFEKLFGLGYWRNQLFGFNSDGLLIKIDIESGRGEQVSAMTGTDQFWGAGVTTLAPTAPLE